jgi:S1-C subfamily serine protease
METIDYFTPATGLIIVLTQVTTTIVTGTGRRRRVTTNTQTKTTYGSGFIVDGVLENNLLRDSSSSTYPIVASVAHLIPTTGSNRYFFKLFDTNTKISKIYELNLVSYNRSVDLCIFDFITSIVGPLCLQWRRDSDVKSGEQCYVVGYPLGDAQLSIVDGSVRDPTYCMSNLSSGIDQIYHSAPATNGNSGGCILDKNGKIIGVHAWGYYQNSNLTYENFSGGPSTKSAYPILSFMLNNKSLAIQKYHPRVALGMYGSILDDIFRIIHLNNTHVQALDGVIVQSIVPNNGTTLYSIDTHNKKNGTIKIGVNDIITHIFDLSKNEYIPIGYTKDSPVNILFPRNLTSSIQIRVRKAPNYDISHDVTIDIPYIQYPSLDSFYSNFI